MSEGRTLIPTLVHFLLPFLLILINEGVIVKPFFVSLLAWIVFYKHETTSGDIIARPYGYYALLPQRTSSNTITLQNPLQMAIEVKSFLVHYGHWEWHAL